MELKEAARGGRPFVERYGPGGFRISGRDWRGSVLVQRDQVVAWDRAAGDDLDASELAGHLAGRSFELLIIGFGARSEPIRSAEREVFKDAGLAVEGMDTGAACRTYNLLAGEGRAVGAALIAL